MTTPNPQSLLRRTSLVALAVAGFFCAADAGAANIKLNNSTTTDCTYSGMTIDPAGNVTVQCTGTAPATGPGTFSLSTSGSGVAASSTQNPSVVRSNGSQGAVTVNYTTSGCASGSGTVSFGDGDTAAKTLSITVGASGTCTVTLSSPTLGSIGSPASATFTVQAQQPTAPEGCPTGFVAPSDLIQTQMSGSGNLVNLMAKSGQVIAVALPAIPWYSGKFAMVDSPAAYTPDPVTIEMSVNKCPGYMDGDRSTPYKNACNKTGLTTRSYNGVDWLVANLTDPNTAAAYNMCWAADGGQYYVNLRYTYNGCPYGAQACGFQASWYKGPY